MKLANKRDSRELYTSVYVYCPPAMKRGLEDLALRNRRSGKPELGTQSALVRAAVEEILKEGAEIGSSLPEVGHEQSGLREHRVYVLVSPELKRRIDAFVTARARQGEVRLSTQTDLVRVALDELLAGKLPGYHRTVTGGEVACAIVSEQSGPLAGSL